MRGILPTLTKMAQFGRIVHWLSNKVNLVACGALVVMMVLTWSDVIGRYVFNHPIIGVVDATGLIAVLIIAFGLARTQILRGHISIDFFVLRLRRRGRAILGTLVWLVSFGLMSIITWRIFAYAMHLQQVGAATMTVKIILYPFVYVLALAFGVLCLVLLMDFIKSLAEAVRK